MAPELPGAAKDDARTAPSRSLVLTVPTTAEAVGILRRAAADLAREHGADDDLAFDVALAVSEAVTNAVKYAYGRKGEEEGKVELSARARDRFLEISVRDWGMGFGTGSSDGLGMGLALIARTSAEMTVDQDGQGTQVRMRFSLASP
jgi:anti-sigma regulatory factor (Ser/Thr protein kinase)